MVSKETTSTEDCENRTAARELDKVELLAFLGPRDMGRNKWIHERLKVWTPPLCQCVSNHPLIIDTFSCELRADWCKALVQPGLEALNLVVFGAKVVARTIVVVSTHGIALVMQKIEPTA